MNKQWFKTYVSDAFAEIVVSTGMVLVIVMAAAYAFASQKPQVICDQRAAAAYILTTERPQMGPIELKMWVDVCDRHYSAHGISTAVCAALLAQENHFKTYRVSSVGAQGAFQIMPNTWKGSPECPKTADLFEVEVAAECSARIFEKNLKDTKSIEAALRTYVAGPGGQKNAQWYADQILSRLARATQQTCPAAAPLYLTQSEKQQ